MVTMVMMLSVLFALYSILEMSIRVYSFGKDLDGNRVVDVPDEQITYALSLSGSRRALLRNGQPTLEFFEPGGLSFEYLDELGDPSKGEAEVSFPDPRDRGEAQEPGWVMLRRLVRDESGVALGLEVIMIVLITCTN
jgi:hypothetical protein